MKNRKLKKPVLYGLYAVGFVALFGVLYLVDNLGSTDNLSGQDNGYVDKTIFDFDAPVVSTSDTIVKPYVDESVVIVKNYYDYQGDAEIQEKSLIYYENTYLQNSGVSYGKDDSFDVVAVLDGTVTSVKEDQSLGKIVEITHSNDIISIYQSLGSTNVTEGAEVKQGDIIGTSGTCNIESGLNNHLHFELIVKGLIVNPENYYDKKVSEL